MKKVVKNTRPAHVLGGHQESPEKRTGIYRTLNLSWLKWSLKLQRVCIGRGRV